MNPLQVETYGKNLSKTGFNCAIVVFKRLVAGRKLGKQPSSKLYIYSDTMVGYVDLLMSKRVS
jgi:hypothetical protein